MRLACCRGRIGSEPRRVIPVGASKVLAVNWAGDCFAVESMGVLTGEHPLDGVGGRGILFWAKRG